VCRSGEAYGIKNLPAERVRVMHVTRSRSPELSLCDRAERPDKPLDLLLGVVIKHRNAHPVAANRQGVVCLQNPETVAADRQFILRTELAGMMIKVETVVPRDGYKLWLRFNDGVEGVADLSDLAGRGVMCAWDDQSVFEAVTITTSGAIEWPGEIDLCADSLYLRVTGKRPEQLFPNLVARTDA